MTAAPPPTLGEDLLVAAGVASLLSVVHLLFGLVSLSGQGASPVVVRWVGIAFASIGWGGGELVLRGRLRGRRMPATASVLAAATAFGVALAGASGREPERAGADPLRGSDLA